MKYDIKIKYNKDEKKDYSLSIDKSYNFGSDFTIEINTNKKDLKIKDIIINEDSFTNFKETIKSKEDSINKSDLKVTEKIRELSILDEDKEFITYLLKNNILEDNINYISFDFNNINIKDFIENNKELSNKKYKNLYEFNSNKKEEIDEFYENNKEFEDIINITLSDENVTSSLRETKNSLDFVYDIVNKINEKDFSEIEKVLYVYDFVRYYNFYNKMDIDLCKSFNIIVKKLGFKCDLQDIYHKGNHPKKSMIYIKDSKYKINGVYYFDPSYNIDNLNDYKFFAKTRDKMKELENITDNYNGFEFVEEKLVKTIKKLYERKSEELIEMNAKNLLVTANNISTFIYGDMINESTIDKYLINIPKFIYKYYDEENYNEIMSNLKRAYKKFKKPIEGEKFVDILYNVRKEENKDNEEFFKFDKESLKDAYASSYFCFKIHYLSKEEQFIYNLFGNINIYNDSIKRKEDFENYYNEYIKDNKTLELK